MTITGKVVLDKKSNYFKQKVLPKEITWDGKDDFGNKIGKGVYVYKPTSSNPPSPQRAEKFENL
jgi:flagellar hook assembly protein FlgD